MQGDYFLMSDQSVFKIVEDQIIDLKIPIQDYKKYFIHDKVLCVLTSSNQLEVISLDGGENYTHAFGQFKSIDFSIHENTIYVLGHKSLLMLDHDAFVDNTFKVKNAIPLFEMIEDGKILKTASDQIVYTAGETIKVVDLKQLKDFELPKIKIESDDGKIKILNSNHWTDQIKYSYYYSGDEGNETIWSGSSSAGQVTSDNSYNSLKVSMTDDVFAQTIRSNTIDLLPQHSGINYGLYLIALLFIFVSGILGLRLISNKN
jgi:hypothetical protein